MSADNARPWQVLRQVTVYAHPLIRLHRADVQLPDGTIVDGHHIVDLAHPAVGIVPVGADGRILLIEHYRFITDTVGWEVPAGRVDDGEDLSATAARELHEETGYRADRLDYLGMYHSSNGFSNHTVHLYLASGLQQVDAVQDQNEVMRLAWFTPQEVWTMIGKNEIRNGLTLMALLWHIARMRET
ncbi:MAG: NUDIX hydrolase [Chloroflexaceae bacterium]